MAWSPVEVEFPCDIPGQKIFYKNGIAIPHGLCMWHPTYVPLSHINYKDNRAFKKKRADDGKWAKLPFFLSSPLINK